MFLSILMLPFMIYQTMSNNFDFSYDYAVFKRNDTMYALNLYYEIPHRNLFFLKTDDRFVNRYQTSLQLLDKKELVAGQLFTRTIQVNTYDETHQQNLKSIDSFNIIFNLKNKRTDKLTTMLRINDLHSTNAQDYQFPIELPTNTSRILFFTNNTINPKHTYPQELTQSDTLNLTMEIYNQNVSYCSLWLNKKVETRTTHPSFRGTKKDKPVTTVKQYFSLNDISDNPFITSRTLNNSLALDNLTDFASGSYQVKIVGYNINNRKLFETNADFDMGISKFQNDQDYFDLVDKLVYIATEQEMKRLKQVMIAERESTWQAFWKEYDPTPTTEFNEQEIEYFERIIYCVQNFSKGDNGYRSQRAQVYMKYGQPDFIESRPFERYSNPLEIWYYYTLSKKYVFVDYHGFGEYILYEETRI